jgi:hypothetical protein
MNIESRNTSELSKAIQSLLIRDLVNQGGFDLVTAIKIVSGTDLEKAFLGELVANLANRCATIEKLFDLNYDHKSDLYRIDK